MILKFISKVELQIRFYRRQHFGRKCVTSPGVYALKALTSSPTFTIYNSLSLLPEFLPLERSGYKVSTKLIEALLDEIK